LEPVGYILLVRKLREANDPDACSNTGRERGLRLRVPEALIVVVSQDDQALACEVLLATGRQAIADAAEGDRAAVALSNAIHILFPPGPEAHVCSIEVTADVGHRPKPFGLAILPAGPAFRVRYAIGVERPLIAMRHDLDADGDTALFVDVAPLL